VAGNRIGTNPSCAIPMSNGGDGVYIGGGARTNKIGGSALMIALGNVISGNTGIGVAISGTGTNNNIVANNYIGTNGDGTAAVPNTHGIYIFAGARNNIIGGSAANSRNVISGNSANGISLNQAQTTGNKVTGNYIGIDRTGKLALPNSNGVAINAASANFIGGTTSDERNVISGNTEDGVFISGDASLNKVTHNYIGTDRTGTLPLSNDDGVAISSASGNAIGGSLAAGNRIAFNRQNGVLVYGASQANTIWRNSIFSNAKLGINLRPVGEPINTVTLNDRNDPDTGPHNLQNFPVIQSIDNAGGNSTVNATLNSVPGSYYIHLYRSPAADPSGYGEGQTFVAVKTVTIASGSNDVSFSFAVAGTFSGQFFTATATRQRGGTSEFSASKKAVVITDFSPGSGPSGTEVMIHLNGAAFGDVQFVTFNGARATFTDASTATETILKAIVPDGATTGRITVGTSNGDAESDSDFVVVVPQINNSKPSSSAVLSALPSGASPVS